MKFLEILVPLAILLLLNLPGIIQAIAKAIQAKNSGTSSEQEGNSVTYTEPPLFLEPETGPVPLIVPEVELLPDKPTRSQNAATNASAVTNSAQGRGYTTPAAEYAGLLSSPTEVRKAMILTEILRRPEENW